MLTQRQADSLAHAAVFRDCGELPRWFLEKLEVCRFDAGEAISPGGDGGACVLLRGKAAARGESGVALNFFEEGSFFGVASLFGGAEYVSTVRAESACEVVFVGEKELERLFAECPAAALSYIRFLSGRIRFLNSKIAAFTAPSAAEALLVWARENAADGVAVAGRGWSALARTLGIGRASLYRAMDELEQSGRAVREGERGLRLVACPGGSGSNEQRK